MHREREGWQLTCVSGRGCGECQRSGDSGWHRNTCWTWRAGAAGDVVLAAGDEDVVEVVAVDGDVVVAADGDGLSAAGGDAVVPVAGDGAGVADGDGDEAAVVAVLGGVDENAGKDVAVVGGGCQRSWCMAWPQPEHSRCRAVAP